ncbi:MAG: cell wall-active antibiotics response protein [Proteobacteria bacterium]|nr:cell wall-active antibiotics response protein [Pseudomonadota bacterium]
MFSIMGGATRRGAWEPPARLRAFTFMGGVDLDFREADLLEGESVVECLAIMGGIQIRVPPDVNLRVSGLGILGGFDQTAHRANDDPGTPTLHVRGLALFGGVSVRVVERGEEPDRKRVQK